MDENYVHQGFSWHLNLIISKGCNWNIWYYFKLSSLKYINDEESRQCCVRYNCDNLWVGRLACYWVIITIHGAPICFRPDTLAQPSLYDNSSLGRSGFYNFLKLISASWGEASRAGDTTLSMFWWLEHQVHVRSRWLTQLWLLYLGVGMMFSLPKGQCYWSSTS